MPTALPRTTTSNGIAYHQSGEGPPIILVHGVGLRADSWFPQIEALRSAYAVYAVDMPGHGESARLDGPPTLARFVECIGGFIEDAVAAPAILAGHSMGAMIGLELASRFPALCRGVAALNAVYRRSPEALSAVQQRAEQLCTGEGPGNMTGPVARWFGTDPAGRDGELADFCRGWLADADQAGYADAYTVFASEDGPSDPALAALSAPALFLTGDNDLNSTPEMSHAMAARALRGQAVIVRGAGHLAQLTHQELVSDALRAFAKRCMTVGRDPQSAGTHGA